MRSHYAFLFVMAVTVSWKEAGAVSGRAGAFSMRDAGARATGLADAQTAAPLATAALVANPAGLYLVHAWQGGYAQSQYSDFEGSFNAFAAWRKKEAPWTIATSWNRKGDAVFAEDEIRLGGNYSLGTVHAGADWVLHHAGSGVGGTDFVDNESGKNHRVVADAWGWMGMDAGLIVTPFGSHYALGMVFQNLLSQLAWSSTNEAGEAAGDYTQFLPVTMRYGFMAQPDPFMGFHVDLEPSLYHDGESRLATGIEFTPLEMLRENHFKNHIRDLLKVRVGYGRNIFTSEAYHRLALGAGLKTKYREYELNLDLGYQFLLSLQTGNALSFGISLSH